MSDRQRKLCGRNIPSGLPLKPSTRERMTNNPIKKKVVCYEPISWSKYFDYKDDIQTDCGTFRVYRRGVEGPLLFFLHGGGFSALSWALLSSIITEEVNCQCMAMDLRGHGDTHTDDDTDLSADTLASDVGRVILALFPTEAPAVILLGHSMGGAVAVHAASKRLVPSLTGVGVIDVVEGSAMEALFAMQNFLRSRPDRFKTLDQAIEWSVRSGQIRNPLSARVSFPGQLKNLSTGDTATSEMDRGIHLLKSPSSPESPHSDFRVPIKRALPIAEDDTDDDVTKRALPIAEEDEGDDDVIETPAVPVTNGSSHSKSFKTTSPERTHGGYTWRIDLTQTEQYWTGWFKGLSSIFLSLPEPKVLLLAGVDRLDKELTIGQMQGKFQIQVLPQSGHAVHEDVPEKVADCLATYLVRNKFCTPKVNFEKVFPCC